MADRFVQEYFQLIVMDPVAGIGDGHHSGVADRFPPWVSFRYRQETIEAPEHKSRAGDLAEEFDGILDMMAVGRQGTNVVVEFPHQRSIGLPICSMRRKMLRHGIA